MSDVSKLKFNGFNVGVVATTQYFDHIKTNKIIKQGKNIIVKHNRDAYEFINYLKKYELLSKIFPLPLCFVNISKDKKVEIIVFENIVLNDNCVFSRTVSHTTLDQILMDENPALYPWIMEVFNNENRQKWYSDDNIYPEERGVKRISAFKKYTPTKFAAKFIFNKDTKILKSRHSENLGFRISDEFRPLKLQVVNSIREIRYAYKNGPESCMRPHSSRPWGYLPNFEPVDFYAHCPQTKLAFVEQNGAVIARCVLFTNNNKTWFYGRIFTSTKDVHNKFKNLLKRNNIKNGFYNKKVPLKLIKDFRIKGTKKTGEVFVPLPYFDIKISPMIYVNYDTKNLNFIFTTTNSNGLKVFIGGTKGYISTCELQLTVCHNCSEPIRTYDTRFIAETGEVFGSIYCGEESGFILAHRGDDTRIFVHRDTFGLIRDTRKGRTYINSRVAIDNGCVPYIELDLLKGLLNFPEDYNNSPKYSSFTSNSSKYYCGLLYKKRWYSINNKTLRFLILNKMASIRNSGTELYDFIPNLQFKYITRYAKHLIKNKNGEVVTLILK